ncbi:unnamed protein product [Meloidogyne enterolobii]|uniref:Uncharacterized protein n=1 Tax=Meloidogyne enterolobii TaxID=390850 RepID=A0ACB0Y4E7_MELEN
MFIHLKILEDIFNQKLIFLSVFFKVFAMVCEKCTNKISKLATVHVDKNASGSQRLTNENKFLSSKQKFKPGVGEFKRCRVCKKMTHHIAANYCQDCAYQKGICPMCGRKQIETCKYRQSLT